MIRCENLSDADLSRIGSQIGDAFLAEPGVFSALPEDIAHRLFTLIARTGYETGHLYTTGENQEGFCIYWTKDQRPGLWVQLRMGLKMARILPLKLGLRMKNSQNNWTPTEKRYAKHEDFVEVFLLAVRTEYQGKGFFREMLRDPFELAKQRNTICVLDTDTKCKAEKYSHVGMHVVASSPQRSGITMYALEI